MATTLVFGASLKPHRYSSLAIQRLQQNGVETLAFGPRAGEVNGVEVGTDLDEIAEVDTITLYLNPQRQQQYYQDILDLKPRRVIFNPGTENPEFYSKLEAQGIEVEVACTLVLLGTGQYETV